MNLSTIIKKIIKKVIFYDVLEQKSSKIKKIYGKQRCILGENKYTIVSAVYNVDKYLEAYFESIVYQTLKFEEHIHLVIVDDGSPDHSANIIKTWQEKYPNNITYVKQENGGQASARNLGMEYVKTEWVTFIDPDDFLDYRYFEEVDSFLGRNKDNNIGLVSCNFIFYCEKENNICDSHALKYRFKKNEKIVTPSNMEGHIQLSASSVFFKSSLLKEKDIKFSENIQPNFEDGHFVNRYFIKNNDINIAFLKKAKYLYRKRSNETSTMDTSWNSIGRFNEVLENGYLDILKTSHGKFTKIPLYIQRTVLYDLMWHFKLFLNNSYKLNHLTVKQKKKYLSLIEEIFQFIDINTIMDFNLAGILDMHKQGLLVRYKRNVSSARRCYIDDYDTVKHEVRLSYFYYDTPHEHFLVNNKLLIPRIHKIRKYDFADELFIYEKSIWVPLAVSDSNLILTLDGKQVVMTMSNIDYESGITVSNIVDHFQKNTIDQDTLPLRHIFYRFMLKYHPLKQKYKNAWLCIDRDIQADDNAEHLYRYIVKHRKNANIFFALRKSSHDWNRLKEEGFNLIAFDSWGYKLAYIQSKYLISSHADHYITDYFPKQWYKDIMQSKFVFLQHGVIKDDLSNWLNEKNIHCFVTTSPKEYHSISGDHTHYKFSKKEVVLTGLPRHDSLLSGIDKQEKMILIMPTWRKSLVGEKIGQGHSRRLNKNFEYTSYLKHWKALLHSKRLEKLSLTYGYKIIFFPHSYMQPYINVFNVPEYIETLIHTIDSIQILFQKASLLITDYSSVAFEMGMMQREVIYYQFDHSKFFGGEHSYQKGYFDYKSDGFGPVCYKEDEVLNALDQFLKSGEEVDQKYLNRMKNFFTFHDTGNCKRVLSAIESLNMPIKIKK